MTDQITTRTDYLSDIRPLWVRIAAVQDRMQPAEFIAKMRRDNETPLRATTAWQGEACVGVMMFWPAAQMPEAVRILAELGKDPAKYIIRGNIYVHPDHRGRGISDLLYAAQNEYLARRGYIGGVGYGYETAEIASWAANRPGIEVHDMTDRAGYSVVLSRIAPDADGGAA